jgi:hypothetical protein
MTSTKLRIGQSDLASPSTSGNVLTSNGTAWVSAAAAGDGWTSVTWASPTRTSATTFTVAQNVTTLIGKGTKLKFTDTTTKYLQVFSATFGAGVTTIVTIATTDYALVGNPSSIYYSNVEFPIGFPTKFNYLPTVTAQTGSITSYTVNSATYSLTSAATFITANISITNAGTGSGALFISNPFTLINGNGSGTNGADGLQMQLYISSGSLVVAKYNNGTVITTGNIVPVSIWATY